MYPAGSTIKEQSVHNLHIYIYKFFLICRILVLWCNGNGLECFFTLLKRKCCHFTLLANNVGDYLCGKNWVFINSLPNANMQVIRIKNTPFKIRFDRYIIIFVGCWLFCFLLFLQLSNLSCKSNIIDNYNLCKPLCRQMSQQINFFFISS